MPMTVPTERAPVRFDPIHITDDDLDDLVTFTGLSRDQCLERVRSYSLNELAEAWRRSNPNTAEAVQDFYRKTDLYLWELMQWHSSPLRYPYWDSLSYFVEHFPPDAGWRRVYDFGCGVGTDGLFLASRGYDVTLVDVDSPTFRFAQHRFNRRGLGGTFLESSAALPEPTATYDAVICFDVLEHLPDPLEAAQRLIGALRTGGMFLQQGTFTDLGSHPCHLPDGVSRFGGLKWHIHLASLGLRNVTGMLYRKSVFLEGLIQRARFSLWRATGVWLVRVPHRG
jgi:SAM-dependent methyltransferase